MNDASAICVSCFKAGGHEEHDYVLYRSESGGCCDCGDVASWFRAAENSGKPRFSARLEAEIGRAHV